MKVEIETDKETKRRRQILRNIKQAIFAYPGVERGHLTQNVKAQELVHLIWTSSSIQIGHKHRKPGIHQI
jgi:hypothetical protein